MTYEEILMPDLEKRIYKLTKEQLADFCNVELKYNTKKQELLDILLSLIKGNEVILHKFYNQYSEIFGVIPSIVEETLKITKTERKRFEEEGKLKVVDYEDFHAYGKTLYTPLYDRVQIMNLTQEDIEQWRNEHKSKINNNRKKAINKAKETKNQNELLKENSKKEFKKMLKSWYKIDSKLGATFELAYWLVWIDKWSKENNNLKIKAKGKKQYYYEQKRNLDELESDAIRELLKTDYKKVSFYRPKYHEKVTNVSLCQHHYECYCDNFNYNDTYEYFEDYRDEIMQCPNCTFDKVDDFYSQYYISIEDERIDNFKIIFSFPYMKGKDFLPSIDELPKAEYKEQDRLIRYDRTLFVDEKIIYPENKVIEKFKEAYEKYQMYYGK